MTGKNSFYTMLAIVLCCSLSCKKKKNAEPEPVVRPDRELNIQLAAFGIDSYTLNVDWEADGTNDQTVVYNRAGVLPTVTKVTNTAKLKATWTVTKAPASEDNYRLWITEGNKKAGTDTLLFRSEELTVFEFEYVVP